MRSHGAIVICRRFARGGPAQADHRQRSTGHRLLLSAEKWKEAKLLELRRIATSNPGEGNLGKCAIALSEASKWKSDLIVIFRLDEELRDRQLALKVPDINTTNLQRDLEGHIRLLVNGATSNKTAAEQR